MVYSPALIRNRKDKLGTQSRVCLVLANLRLRPKGRWQSDLCDKRRNDVSVRRKSGEVQDELHVSEAASKPRRWWYTTTGLGSNQRVPICGIKGPLQWCFGGESKGVEIMKEVNANI